MGHAASIPSASQPPLLMRMGCTNQLITYRAAGNEGVCLQSPAHGLQQLAAFNPAAGDFLGVDDILETTMAHANLSDIAQYITSQVVAGGTELFIDLTGTGKTGTPFAMLRGVTTTVAQLVANGGIKYIPDAITLSVAFNTPFSFRPDGLETAVLGRPEPSAPSAILNNFNPTNGDLIELKNTLNYTTANPDLSNIANYITAVQSGGNTTLYLDKTGTAHLGTAFAVLEGVNITVSQLVADHALAFDPTGITMLATPSTVFQCRPEGMETVFLSNIHGTQAAQQVQGFSVNQADGLDVSKILTASNIQTDIANIGNFFSTVETGGNTQLWFNPNGSGTGGTLEAVFQGSNFTLNDVSSHNAWVLTH
jgi:hypothetical protein